VDHVPVALLYKSTALEGRAAVARMRESTRSQGKHNHNTTTRANTQHARNQQKTTLPPPTPAQQRTCAIVAPSEQSHVPDRCSCNRTARHAELSRGPCSRCTVIQVDITRGNTTCSGAGERARGRRANITTTPQHAQRLKRTQSSTLHDHQPLPAKQRTSCPAPSEQNHVPN
jgi:hypothetical protein